MDAALADKAVAAIINSTRKTQHLLVVHEAMKRGGIVGEIFCRVNEEVPDLLKSLKTPFRRLVTKNLPLSARPDWNLTPSADSIVRTAKEMVRDQASVVSPYYLDNESKVAHCKAVFETVH